VDYVIHTCREMLSIHKNFLVSCSDRACVTSKGSEQAYRSHSCVVVCHQPLCVYCRNEEAVNIVHTRAARVVALSTTNRER
jgi:hypothetical protein